MRALVAHCGDFGERAWVAGGWCRAAGVVLLTEAESVPAVVVEVMKRGVQIEGQREPAVNSFLWRRQDMIWFTRQFLPMLLPFSCLPHVVCIPWYIDGSGNTVPPHLIRKSLEEYMRCTPTTTIEALLKHSQGQNNDMAIHLNHNIVFYHRDGCIHVIDEIVHKQKMSMIRSNIIDSGKDPRDPEGGTEYLFPRSASYTGITRSVLELLLVIQSIRPLLDESKAMTASLLYSSFLCEKHIPSIARAVSTCTPSLDLTWIKQNDPAAALAPVLRHVSCASTDPIEPSTCFGKLTGIGTHVLLFLSADALFKRYPNATEGDLSTMRSTILAKSRLNEWAKHLGIPAMILRNGALTTVSYAQVLRSIFGSLFLDGCMDACSACFTSFLDTISFPCDASGTRELQHTATPPRPNHMKSQLSHIPELQLVDSSLLSIALTHASFDHRHESNYERLEFLGDAVLGLQVARYIYQTSRHDAAMQSHLVSGLCSNASLSKMAGQWRVPSLIRIGKAHLTEKVMADAAEALIGAVYLHRGLASIDPIIKRYLIQLEHPELHSTFDAKNRLTRSLHTKFQLHPTASKEKPLYTTKPLSDNCEVAFMASVHFRGSLLATGRGQSKKEAETNAALSALRSF